MFSWASIILTALKIINQIMGAVSQDKWMQAGEDAEIAKISAAILQRTTAGKKMMERVNALSEADVDAGLRDLEPK